MKRSIALILGFTTAISFGIWAVNYMINPTPENMSKVGQLIAQSVIPWWLPVIQFLSSWGLFGGLCIIGLLLLIRYGKVPN